jgi:hypothetical protein
MFDFNYSEELASSKQPWSTPALTELKADLIRQQEEEMLYYALNSEEFFRLVNGTASDYRLKEDKKDFDALSVVNAISAYDFAWKETGEREYGFMAHEIQQVMPYLVSGQKDQVDQLGQPMIQRVNYAKLTPVLIKAIQQQQQMIESLQQQLQELAGVTLSK